MRQVLPIHRHGAQRHHDEFTTDAPWLIGGREGQDGCTVVLATGTDLQERIDIPVGVRVGAREIPRRHAAGDRKGSVGLEEQPRGLSSAQSVGLADRISYGGR